MRFDGVQVPAGAAVELAARVARDWPASAGRAAALAAAAAEAWTGWEATSAYWVGTGAAVLQGAVPTGVTVIGLWWD